MEFVDWCEGVSDRPDNGERFGEVLLDGENLRLLGSRNYMVLGLRYVRSTKNIPNELCILAVSVASQTGSKPSYTHWPLWRLDPSLALRADASCSTGNASSASRVVRWLGEGCDDSNLNHERPLPTRAPAFSVLGIHGRIANDSWNGRRWRKGHPVTANWSKVVRLRPYTG